MKENTQEYEITCMMFNILAKRASTVEDPRIRTSDFSARLGIDWERAKSLLPFVEWYCYTKNSVSIPSLSALVVFTHKQGGPDVSFPGEWFGKHIPDIMDKKIPEWKLPLNKSQRVWYSGRRYWPKGRGYWQKVRSYWVAIDIDEKSEDFNGWLPQALEEQGIEDWFPWPSTSAPIGVDEMNNVIMHPEGVFSCLGYRVGKQGTPDDDRQEILDWIFHNKLPRVNDDSYMAEFGEPESSMRLEKMANFLAAEARNFARKRTADYSQSIIHYKDDLDYLYHKYYVGRLGFDKDPNPDFVWPEIPDYNAPHETDTANDAKPKLKVSHEHKSESVTETEPQQPQPMNTVNQSEDKEAGKVSESTDAGVQDGDDSDRDGDVANMANAEVAKPKPPRINKIIVVAIIIALLAIIYVGW